MLTPPSVSASPASAQALSTAAEFDQKLKGVLALLEINFPLRDFQRDSLKALALQNKHVFLVAPTASGKTVPIRLCGYMFSRADALVLLISPLTALSLEFVAGFGEESAVFHSCKLSTPTLGAVTKFVVMSPEVATSRAMTDWYETVKERVCVVVVDEAHAVKHWYEFMCLFIYLVLFFVLGVKVLLLIPILGLGRLVQVSPFASSTTSWECRSWRGFLMLECSPSPPLRPHE